MGCVLVQTLRWITLVTLALFVFAARLSQPALAQATPCTLVPNGSTLAITCYGMPSPAPNPTTLPTMQPGVANRNFNQSFSGNNGSNGGSSLSPGCFTPCGGSPGRPGLSPPAYITQTPPSAVVPACVFNPFCFSAGTMLYATASGAPAGILLQSIGGSGGRGGNGAVGVSGAPGGQGGAGGAISGTIGANGNLQILTTTANTPGLWVRSAGGTGGNGGSGFLSNGASGAPGGSGGAIAINVGANIYTLGSDGYGILAQSLGGNGGAGGSTWAGIGSGGNGASGQSGSNVAVTLTSGGSIFTAGYAATGILAQSIGGFGGTGGGGGGLLTFGGTGSTGGFGGTINVTTQTSTSITTVGIDADAIFAESVGGGGGAGGSGGGFFTIGGGGGPGGMGSSVTVNNAVEHQHVWCACKRHLCAIGWWWRRRWRKRERTVQSWRWCKCSQQRRRPCERLIPATSHVRNRQRYWRCLIARFCSNLCAIRRWSRRQRRRCQRLDLGRRQCRRRWERRHRARRQ